MTDETAGTPGAEAGDAATPQTTGDAATADRNDTSAQVTQEKTIAVPEREFAAWKRDQEQKNERERRLQELEDENRRYREASSPTPAGIDAISGLSTEDEALLRKVAEQGDPVAKRELKRIDDDRAKAQQQRAWAEQLLRIPDREMQERVRLEFNKGGYADVNEARAAIAERDLAELRKPRPKTERDVTPGVPTGARGAPETTPNGKPKMTYDQAKDEIARLRATEGHWAAMAFQSKLEKGDIELA